MTVTAVDSVAMDSLCLTLGEVYPSAVIFKETAPDVTIACGAITAGERQIKMMQVLANTEVVALWVLLNHYYGEHQREIADCSSPDPIRPRSRSGP